MQKIMGVFAILLSLACFALTIGWLRHLGSAGWTRIPSKMANMPADSAIGVTIAILGVAFLAAGASLLGSHRRPPR